MPARPHDPSFDGLAVPVNPWTGQPLAKMHQARIARLKAEAEIFRRALHELDGTTFGSQTGDPRMAMAFVKLDETLLWAVNAILEQDA